MSAAMLSIMYNVVSCCCYRWERVQERCTFSPSSAICGAVAGPAPNKPPNPNTLTSQSSTSCSGCLLFDHAFNYLISLVYSTIMSNSNVLHSHCP